ncbi:MAG TPA: ribosomal protein S18-alanine N-acetyltransferase [Bacilli bacterium]
MTEEDIEQICIIEEESFSSPWTAAAFYNEIVNNHFAHYVVMEWEGQVIGYGGMWAIIDEAHVTNIAIRPQFRGKRLGERLLLELQALACFHGAVKMTLEVRVSNKIAQRLYEKMGFTAAGFRKAYYSDNHEDAIIMWAALPDCSPDGGNSGSGSGGSRKRVDR